MSRYMDADALRISKCNPDIMQNKAHAEGWNLLLDIINNAPTADVAPVARCKECELNDYCARIIRNNGHEPDDYCSYGERKAVE